MFKPWINQAKAFRQYWRLYGGIFALITSPYFIISVVLTDFCFIFWSHDKVSAADIAISAIPNLLGFSVGALAIVLAFSSSPVFERLAEKGKPESFFITLTANLTHFILVQVLALICAITTKLTGVLRLEILTTFFLFYAVLVTLAAGVQLFLTATIYNAGAGLRDQNALTTEIKSINKRFDRLLQMMHSRRLPSNMPTAKGRKSDKGAGVGKSATVSSKRARKSP